MSVIKQEADPSIKEEEASENLMCSLYLSHYDAIHSWAFNSLDIVKGQLIPLCFPIFVHWYVYSTASALFSHPSLAILTSFPSILKRKNLNLSFGTIGSLISM